MHYIIILHVVCKYVIVGSRGRIQGVALVAWKTVRFSERCFIVLDPSGLILVFTSSANFQLFPAHLKEITGFSSLWLCSFAVCPQDDIWEV